jgi:hypothetical protein
MLLGKQSFIINKKLIGITLAAFAGIMFMFLFMMQSNAHFRNWDNKDNNVTFLSLFFVLGIMYSSLAFPAFRSKEKTMSYLMLPASAGEKFVFEILVRIFAFIFLMPLFFWLIVNIEGMIVHSFIPELTNYKFSFGGTFEELKNQGKFEGWAGLLIIQGILFVFITLFTGASHFSKSPLLKSMLTISLILAGFGFFSYLLFKGFNLREYHPSGDRILFISNKNTALEVSAILSTILNMCLLSVAWFKLKEKEV